MRNPALEMTKKFLNNIQQLSVIIWLNSQLNPSLYNLHISFKKSNSQRPKSVMYDICPECPRPPSWRPDPGANYKIDCHKLKNFKLLRFTFILHSHWVSNKYFYHNFQFFALWMTWYIKLVRTWPVTALLKTRPHKNFCLPNPLKTRPQRNSVFQTR